jgi:hypothetical protein
MSEAYRRGKWSLKSLNVSIGSVLVRDEEPRTANLEDRVVVLSVRAGSYFGFNRVASEIWHMLAEPRRVGDILDALLESHDIDADTLDRDVTPFLLTLVEQRLVRVIDHGELR